jgi:PAS domain-containing protein
MAFRATEPLPLHHSWPLSERARHLDLSSILNCAVTDVLEPAALGALPPHHAGCWECDLSDNVLTWSGGVYDIFGLPRGAQVSRREAIGFYADESLAAMERLRAHAIEHKRGFTLDVEILPAIGKRRWVRLIAAPICHGDRVVRLEGLKFVI